MTVSQGIVFETLKCLFIMRFYDMLKGVIMMLDHKSMEKLAQLKAELIAEEPKPEIIYPFRSVATKEPDWNKVKKELTE